MPGDLELLLVEPGNPALELVRQTTSEQTWRSTRRSPERIEAAWRPFSPELRALAIADVTLAGGQGHVRHEIRFSNYQTAGFVAVPYSISEFINGQETWCISLSSISFNNNLSDSIFKP